MIARITLLIALLAGLVPLANAQGPPDSEVRTYVVNPAASTDLTHQFGLSKLRERYCCPYCGYSSPTAGNCPDPLNVSGHPGTVALVELPLSQRVLSLGESFAASGEPTCDIRYGMTNAAAGTANRFLSVIGRPFQPYPGTGTVNRTVYAEWACGFSPAPERVQFVTLPPGVKEPYAEPVFDPGATPPFQTYHNGVLNGASARTPAQIRVQLNPLRCVDGDILYVRWIARETDPALMLLHNHTWRLLIYSAVTYKPLFAAVPAGILLLGLPIYFLTTKRKAGLSP